MFLNKLDSYFTPKQGTNIQKKGGFQVEAPSFLFDITYFLLAICYPKSSKLLEQRRTMNRVYR